MSKIKDELKFDGKDTYFNRFLKRSSDENIINYINNATKENINIFLEYEDENDYLCMYPLYFNFIINCIKKDKKDILIAIENNGFNAFSSSNQDKNNENFYTYLLKRKMQPAILKMSSTFYDYLIKHLTNKLTPENIDDIVYLIKNTERELKFSGKKTFDSFLSLLNKKEFYNIHQIKERIVFNSILIDNFSAEEIKLILDKNNLHNDEKVKKSLLSYFNHHHFMKIEESVNILFKNQQDFLDKIITPYFAEVSYNLADYIIRLPTDKGLHIDNKNTEPSVLIKALSLYTDKNYINLKNLGVNINEKDLFHPLFEYNNDISAIFYSDNLEKQADLKYKFFQNLIKDVENLKYKDMLKIEKIMNNTNFTMFNEKHFSVISKLLIEKREQIKKMSFADINNRNELYHAGECVRLIFIGLYNQLKDKGFVDKVLIKNNSIPHVLANYIGFLEFNYDLLEKSKNEFFATIENSSFFGPLYKKNIANIFNFELYKNNDLNRLRLTIFPRYNEILSWKDNEKSYLNEKSENDFLKFIIDNKHEEILIDYMEKENQSRNQNAVEVEKRLLKIHMGNNKIEPVAKKRL